MEKGSRSPPPAATVRGPQRTAGGKRMGGTTDTEANKDEEKPGSTVTCDVASTDILLFFGGW